MSGNVGNKTGIGNLRDVISAANSYKADLEKSINNVGISYTHIVNAIGNTSSTYTAFDKYQKSVRTSVKNIISVIDNLKKSIEGVEEAYKNYDSSTVKFNVKS